MLAIVRSVMELPTRARVTVTDAGKSARPPAWHVA